MNKTQLQKSVGQRVKLQPAAVAQSGRPLNDDWEVTSVTDDAVELRSERDGVTATLAHDAVYSFSADARRGERYGTLQLHAQLTVMERGEVQVKLLPPRAQPDTFPFERFDPLTLKDGQRDRYFSWPTRDPVHISTDQPPIQLFAFFEPLCHALRVETGREPQFNLPTKLRGEPVYELTPDYRARSLLYGGAGGGAGEAVLVLTEQPARFQNAEELIGHSRPCTCGQGRARFAMSRQKAVALLAQRKLKLACIICGDTDIPLTDEEVARIKRHL